MGPKPPRNGWMHLLHHNKMLNRVMLNCSREPTRKIQYPDATGVHKKKHVGSSRIDHNSFEERPVLKVDEEAAGTVVEEMVCVETVAMGVADIDGVPILLGDDDTR